VKTSPEAVEEEQEEEEPEVAAGNADTETWRARRVSTARPGLGGDLGRTMVVDVEWQETEGERQEDLGICDNSPTNPGALLGAKS
jgi:hypothetical protein